MKKEKQVRSYKRRTKSGKTVTVKAHTAKYEAADEKAKEVSKKPGAGKELEERKKKPVQLELPFDKEEEKKVLDEVKDEEKKSTSKKPSEKKTTKKVRPVGSGTNGPTPKKKSEGKETNVDKQTKAWFNSSPSSFSKVKVSKDKDGDWRIDLSDGSGQVYRSKEAAQKDAKLLRGMYKEWKGSSTKTSMKTTSASASSAFTAAEFKEWYRGTGSAADKKVAKALRAQLGRSGYRKLEDEAIDNYSSRGHLSMFKRVSGGSEVSAKTGKSTNKTEPKASTASGKSSTKSGNVKKETKGDRAVARMHKLVNEALSSTTSDPKALKKQLGALIDYNGGPVNYGDKIGKRIDEIREQLGKRSSSKKRVEKKSDYDYEASMKALENYFAEERKGKGKGKGTPKTSEKTISEQSLNSEGFKTFKMPQIGTLYLGKRGKGAYIKFKGKKNIQKATIDDYEDFITGHNGLTKAQKKQLSSLGYTEHEEY